MGGRYNPWDEARRLGVRVITRELPGTMWGCWHGPSRTVILDSTLVQHERRVTLAHELVHAERGDTCRQDRRTEAAVHAIAARRLVTLDALADALRWTRDPDALAEELWVDTATVEVLLDDLDDAERAWLEDRLAA